MIDVNNLKLKRNERDLQEFLLFCVFTNGKITKKSHEISRKVHLLLKNESNPLEWIHDISSVNSKHNIDYLYEFLLEYSLPRNKKVISCLRDIHKIKNKLEKISDKELKSVYGIGKSISNLFISNNKLPND
jgi:hypothetical protein